MTDEGFREIQLNGKQLVFLFMAATVVSVVIFLCGVLVGRDVRTDRPAAAEEAEIAGTVAPDPPAGASSSSSALPSGSLAMSSPATSVPGTASSTSSLSGPSNAAAEPPAPADEFTYSERLGKEEPKAETLKSSSPAPSRPLPAPKAPAARTAAAPPTAPVPAVSANAKATEPAGPGFAVQVATYPDRRNADLLAERLIGKGYPAFVTGPVKGGAKMIYRVRVGKYQDKRQAEAISSRLEKEEQFKPWIAR